MKKIPTIFKRNPKNMRELQLQPRDDCLWVFDGEGVATRKYDGTCCLVRDGILYRRREVKKGKTAPYGFELVDYDEVTGKSVGWMAVTDDDDDRWHREAFRNYINLSDGTYELCGPKIQGNPENHAYHVLINHSTVEQYNEIERSFDGIRGFMRDLDIEGLVFHHPDGRMAKIKKKDYGQKRK